MHSEELVWKTVLQIALMSAEPPAARQVAVLACHHDIGQQISRCNLPYQSTVRYLSLSKYTLTVAAVGRAAKPTSQPADWSRRCKHRCKHVTLHHLLLRSLPSSLVGRQGEHLGIKSAA
jgi:hypothetical protein